MRSCPTCRSTYTDDTLNFCLVDGAKLYDADSSPTVPYFQPPSIEHVKTISDAAAVPSVETIDSPLPVTAPFLPNNAPAQTVVSAKNLAPTINSALPELLTEFENKNTTAKDNSFKWWLAVIPVLFIAAIGGWALISSQNNLPAINSNINKPVTNTASLNNSVDNSSKTDIAKTNPNAANQIISNVVNPTATPTSIPEAAKDIDMTGTWSGKSGDNPYRLIITDSSGNKFSGTKSGSGYQVAFAGTVDPDSRKVVIRETKLLKGDSSLYSLGVNAGTLSKTGKLSAEREKMEIELTTGHFPDNNLN